MMRFTVMLTYPRLKFSSAMFMAKTQPKMQMLTTTKQLAIPFGIILQGMGQRGAKNRVASSPDCRPDASQARTIRNQPIV